MGAAVCRLSCMGGMAGFIHSAFVLSAGKGPSSEPGDGLLPSMHTVNAVHNICSEGQSFVLEEVDGDR